MKREYKRIRPMYVSMGNSSFLTWNDAYGDVFDKPSTEYKIEDIIASENERPR